VSRGTYHFFESGPPTTESRSQNEPPRSKLRGMRKRIKHNTEHAAELVWLAVAKGYQRRGTGMALVNAACKALKVKGMKFFLVKSLSKRAHYTPYEASRRFFKKTGFVHIDTLDPCPGWDPGSPCDVYAKLL
jgi:GNAT superfamily N-acetyltransferase